MSQPGRAAADRPTRHSAVPIEVVVREMPPRAMEYADEPQWRRVVARARDQGCGTLANVARTILETRRLAHDLVGMLAAVPLSGPEREYARQLAERIPLAIDEAVIAAARGLQLTGIFACVTNGKPLSTCACYRDIVEREIKPVANRLLNECSRDWTGLGDVAVSSP